MNLLKLTIALLFTTVFLAAAPARAQLAISSPTDGSSIIDPGMKLSVTTTNARVGRVDYFIGTTKLCTSSTGPDFACNANYPWADGQTYTITVKSYSKQGKEFKVQAAPVKVTVYLTVPFYRAYHAGRIDHFYTTSAPERDIAVNKNGYNNENVCCRILASQAPGTVPLYRAYHPARVDHFYTINKAEWDKATSKNGYNAEGVAGYVYPTQQPGSVPLYRSYYAPLVDHFYTTGKAEWDNAIKHNHNREGIAAYVFPAR